MSQVFSNYIFNKRKQAHDYVESWQSRVYSLVVFGATMVVIFWASVFLYTSFYFTFMPQESITWPIHFQFRSCEKDPGVCSDPRAVIPVLDPTRGSLLVRGQKYRVVVDLEMPESPVNQRIGMFLVNMEMKSQGGETLRQSSRSSMLRYKSPLLHMLSTTIFAPLLLYGLQEEKQLLTVELFSQYEEDPVIPLSEVHIELASRHLELYGAQLRIHAMFSGLRYFMYHYPLSAATVGVGICMVFLATVVILSWYQFSAPTLSPLQASRGVVTFPNGTASAIRTHNHHHHTLPTTTKKIVEDEAESGGGGGGGGGGGDDGKSRQSQVVPDIKGAKTQDEKVSSHACQEDELSVDERQRVLDKTHHDRDDFEMVTSSYKPSGVSPKEEEEEVEEEVKSPSSLPAAVRSTSSEEESVVRQRVQSVI